jgi:hypothetical protein
VFQPSEFSGSCFRIGPLTSVERSRREIARCPRPIVPALKASERCDAYARCDSPSESTKTPRKTVTVEIKPIAETEVVREALIHFSSHYIGVFAYLSLTPGLRFGLIPESRRNGQVNGRSINRTGIPTMTNSEPTATRLARAMPK